MGHCRDWGKNPKTGAGSRMSPAACSAATTGAGKLILLFQGAKRIWKDVMRIGTGFALLKG